MSAESESSDFSGKRVLKGGLVVAIGLGAAQVTGFARQVVFGYLLGTGPEADALAAALAPLELWWAVMGLAVIFGFTPRLAESGTLGGYAFREVARPVIQIGLGSTLCLVVFAGPILRVFAPGLDFETAELGANLLRVTGFTAALAGWTFAYSALLYSRRRFALPALHAAVVNVVTIVAALTFYSRLGVYSFAAGYVAGALIQLIFSYFYARGLVELQTAAANPELKMDFRTLFSGPGPILLQSLVLEANTAVSRAYASTFGAGMTAAFEYGYKVYRVPFAILVVPLSESLLPEVSSLDDTPEHRSKAVGALKRAALAAFAAGFVVMVGLIALRRPVVRLLFERGEFSAKSTEAVATALASYMPVVIGRGLTELLSRTLFGMGIYRQPGIAAGAALAINCLISVMLPPRWPILIGLGAIVGFGVSATLVVRHVWTMGRTADAAEPRA